MNPKGMTLEELEQEIGQVLQQAGQQLRRVGWDGYVNVRGNRYSVPGELAGQTVAVRLGLDDRIRIFHADQLVASHSLRPAEAGWNTVPAHHAALWQATVNVEQRSLEAYEEVTTWS